MSVQDMLQAFVEHHKNTVKALQLLKDTVKKEGSKRIQERVMVEDFEAVNKLVLQLNHFTQLEYKANAEEVKEFVEMVFSGEVPRAPILATSPTPPPAKRTVTVEDIENILRERGYSIVEKDGNFVEIAKDRYHYYLEIDIQEGSEADYQGTMEKRNSLKNIGFITLDDTRKEQAKRVVAHWAEKNPMKCNLLTVHVATVDELQYASPIFETMTF